MAWHENNPSALIDLAEDLSSSCHSDNPQEETVNIHSYRMFISLSLSFILIIYRETPSCPCTICVSTGCTLDELTLCLSIEVTKTKSWFFSYWVIGMGIKTPSNKNNLHPRLWSHITHITHSNCPVKRALSCYMCHTVLLNNPQCVPELHNLRDYTVLLPAHVDTSGVMTCLTH